MKFKVLLLAMLGIAAALAIRACRPPGCLGLLCLAIGLPGFDPFDWLLSFVV